MDLIWRLLTYLNFGVVLIWRIVDYLKFGEYLIWRILYKPKFCTLKVGLCFKAVIDYPVARMVFSRCGFSLLLLLFYCITTVLFFIIIKACVR